MNFVPSHVTNSVPDDYQCECMDGFYGTGKDCWDYDEERFRYI